MKRIKKELFWIIAIVCVTFIIALLIFGNALWDGRLLELQLHDTYFIFPKSLFLTIILGLLILGSLLIRGIYFKLNNRIVNIVLSIIFIFILLYLIDLLSFIHSYVKDYRSFAINQKMESFRIYESMMLYWFFGILIFIAAGIFIASSYKVIKPKFSR